MALPGTALEEHNVIISVSDRYRNPSEKDTNHNNNPQPGRVTDPSGLADAQRRTSLNETQTKLHGRTEKRANRKWVKDVGSYCSLLFRVSGHGRGAARRRDSEIKPNWRNGRDRSIVGGKKE